MTTEQGGLEWTGVRTASRQTQAVLSALQQPGCRLPKHWSQPLAVHPATAPLSPPAVLAVGHEVHAAGPLAAHRKQLPLHLKQPAGGYKPHNLRFGRLAAVPDGSAMPRQK